MLSQYRGSKSRSSLEAAAPSDDGEPHALVLPSSTELFYFYAQNLEQCANLFTGQPLYDLCQLHKKWLRLYAGTFILPLRLVMSLTFFQTLDDVLVASMKRPTVFTRRSVETRLDINELKNACVLINTADYCHNTAMEVCVVHF